MNHRLYLSISAAAMLMWSISACKEYPPYGDLTRNNSNTIGDTTYVESPVQSPETRNVLIEEFTGVRCPNCPQGHVIVADLKTANPGRIVSVAEHPINSLGYPYPGQPNLQTQDAQTLFDFIGQIGFEPVAAIDRKLFSGQSAVNLDKNLWTNFANQQIASATTPVNLNLDVAYDSVARVATITVELHYTSAVTEPNKLTLMFTESEVVADQLNGSNVITGYVHTDVLRKVITDIQGDLINTTIEAGRVVRKIYSVPVDVNWDHHHVAVVAFVHQYQSAKEVYQAKEKELIP